MSVAADHPGVSTLVGTPKEVRARLGRSQADRVLVMTFDHIMPQALAALEENMSNVASSMLELLLHRQDRESLERLVELLVPRDPPSPRLLNEAGMLVKARRAVLESGDWLTAAQIAELTGLTSRNPSAQPNKWKKQGQIFAISHNGSDYFPGYGLDADAGFRPLKSLAKVIEAFGDHKDGWGLAYWFRAENSFLGGQRPQDVLATSPARVIAAALDEIQVIAHA